jgi:hypothetical protein
MQARGEILGLAHIRNDVSAPRARQRFPVTVSNDGSMTRATPESSGAQGIPHCQDTGFHHPAAEISPGTGARPGAMRVAGVHLVVTPFDRAAGRWESCCVPTAKRLFSRHHVDLVRVASALCRRGRL